jgi:exodeoxyribonuclease-5
MDKLNDNQILLPNNKIITLNYEQYDGIFKIRKWLKSNDKIFTLSGFAGTGKTLCLRKITKEYYGGKVVSAPTHKAKKIISRRTGIKGETLHSLLGLRPDVSLDEFNPNNPIFNPIAIPRINEFNLVVIDEASMINEKLYELIKEKTFHSKTKILFVGDPAQIPPIGEKESVVFSFNDNESSNYHFLSKIERQNNDNPLTFIYDSIRNNLTSDVDYFSRKTNINNNGDGIVFTLDKIEFRKKIIDKYKSDEFKKNIEYTKVIAWRNSTIMESNKIIRNELLGENKDIIEVGDILMGYRSITDETQRFSIIENSCDYFVINKKDITENQYGLLGFEITLKEELEEGVFDYKTVFIIDSNNFDNLHKYAKIHDTLRDDAKKDKKKWKHYYNFRRNNLLLTNINKYRNGIHRDDYDIINKDLDYAYCISAHKSQGSTYEHVFILEEDINRNRLIKERNQIKYVALTRPTSTATLLTTKIDL